MKYAVQVKVIEKFLSLSINYGHIMVLLYHLIKDISINQPAPVVTNTLKRNLLLAAFTGFVSKYLSPEKETVTLHRINIFMLQYLYH